MAANTSYTKKYILKWKIVDWCFDWFDTRWPIVEDWAKCSDWKLFSTSFVRDLVNDDFLVLTWEWTHVHSAYPWIQINKYEYWTTTWLFTDVNVDSWYYRYDWSVIHIWDYLLVYKSTNEEWSWFAWQIRMVTGFDSLWRITVDSPWLWFKTPDTSNLAEWEEKLVQWNWVKYEFFRNWWECIGYSIKNKIYVIVSWYWDWDVSNGRFELYNQDWWETVTDIVSVAEANDKIFILTDNGYIHYSNSRWVYNKFFINDDMDAGWDKTSIVAYKDFLLAFGRRKIAVWVPDEQNVYWTMYNQSTTIWTWSRYSYAEYDWDLIFVSNDKRLLALWVSATAWRYMLQHEDVWDMLNWKLATMIDTDEVFIGSYDNNLRVFVNTRDNPYEWDNWWHATHTKWANTMTHIYKFDKLFKVWSEDHIDWWCMQWVNEWVFYWQYWIYVRDNYEDITWKHWEWASSYKARITAFLIENENNKISVASNWTSTWAPDLFRVAKLNRLITTLWPGAYSDNTKIHITSYLQWIGVEYEFPIWTGDDTVNNKWVDLISKAYKQAEATIDECLLQAVEDSNNVYQPSCTNKKLEVQSLVADSPRCNSYKEFLIQDHWICVNDTLYKLAPTMPLVTSFWENQKYSTEIRLDITSENWDILCFGGWMAELFLAPYWLKWSDWEYELSPTSSC
jgi:hypothetical protein